MLDFTSEELSEAHRALLSTKMDARKLGKSSRPFLNGVSPL